MLNFLRKKTKAIVWTVVVAFVAWGGYAVSVQFEEANRSPGKMGGKEVSFQEYQLASRAVQIFVMPPSGQEPPSAELLEAQTWEFLMLSREAKRRKVDISDEEVKAEISRLFGAGEGATFLPEQYFQTVRQTFREEPREFEQQLKEHLRIRKLLGEVRKEMRKPEEELKRWLLDLWSRSKIQIYKARS